MPTLHFLVPGDWLLPTGGYTYDRRMALALQTLGWTVEVAQIGGLSTTWYTWVEQGRDIALSAAALARLADALRLNPAERAYLFELADLSDPEHNGTAVPAPTVSLQSCVDSINVPAYILDRHWNVLAFNAALDQVFAGWMGAQAQPNLLRFIFLDAQAPAIVVDWETRANRVVAEFRADIGVYLDDADTTTLIDELLTGSPVFRHWWSRQVVVEREGGLVLGDRVVGLTAGREGFAVAGVGGRRLLLPDRPLHHVDRLARPHHEDEVTRTR